MSYPVTGECPKCREQNPVTLSFCSFCGERLPWVPDNKETVGPYPYSIAEFDGPSPLYLVSSAVLPLLGGILYYSSRNETPLRAKNALQGMTAGGIVQVMLLALGSAMLVNRPAVPVQPTPSPAPIRAFRPPPRVARRLVPPPFAPTPVPIPTKGELEMQARQKLNDQLKNEGRNITCTNVVLQDSATTLYTGEAFFSDGSSATIEVTLTERELRWNEQ